jgi:polyisoprenyl-phosphate glycosyltransferase
MTARQFSPQAGFFDTDSLNHLAGVEIINLRTNLGHQQAIAVGLCIAVEDEDCDAILVMDADGEDSPLAIDRLIEVAGEARDFCIVAQRGKRSENLVFRVSYMLYKLLFRLLAGRQITFGNFCLFSYGYARRLVSIPYLWSNLPAAVIRSRLPIEAVSVDRARRYAGQTKMNLISLVVHGLSGISVYAETIFVRALFLTLALFFLDVFSIAFVLTLRIFFPRYATPGWATTVSFGFSIILVQTFTFTLSFILTLLNNRVQHPVIPHAEYKHYVDYRQTLFIRDEKMSPVCSLSSR